MSLFSLVTGGEVNTGSLITDILFALCTVALLGAVSHGRSSRETALSLLARLGEALALFLMASSLDVACFHLGISGYPGPNFPSLFTALAVYAALQRGLPVTDRVVRCFTFAALFVLIVGITGTILPAVTTLRRLAHGMAVPSLISYTCMVAATMFLRHFSIARFSFVPQHYILLVVLIDVLGAIAGNSFILYTAAYESVRSDSYASIVLNRFEQSVSAVNLIVDVSFLLLICVAYLMFYVLAKEHAERTELLVTKKSEVDLASQMRVTKSMYESLRMMRHELKNHDAYLAALLDAEDYDGLRAAFDSYVEKSSPALSGVSCGNLTVDAVVNAKMALARSQGVEIKTALAVPSELPYEESDIFRLLANLLDNAIEGTVAAGAAPGPVELRIVPRMGYYFVSTSNPCDPRRVHRNRAGALLTTKADGEVHGYGTKVIRQIAEKYHGAAYFSVDGDKFLVNVMLTRGDEEREDS